MKRKLVIATAAAALLIGGGATAFATSDDAPKPPTNTVTLHNNDDDDDDDDRDRTPKSAKVTLDEATAAALKVQPGTLTSIDLDDDEGVTVWEAEIDGKDGKHHELNINATTAKVTLDDDDHDDADDDNDSD